VYGQFDADFIRIQPFSHRRIRNAGRLIDDWRFVGVFASRPVVLRATGAVQRHIELQSVNKTTRKAPKTVWIGSNPISEPSLAIVPALNALDPSL
jgi:hypothetical protein